MANSSSFIFAGSGSAASDVKVRDGRPYNYATLSRPCIIHANGWEKQPLIDIVRQSGKISPIESDIALERKAAIDKAKVWRLALVSVSNMQSKKLQNVDSSFILHLTVMGTRSFMSIMKSHLVGFPP